MDFKKLANQYKDELLDNVLPFWLENSQDHEYGGYFTCLDREGRVFDTDKFIWLQGREVWMFSMLYNKVEKRKEWLDCAVQGGEFLKRYGHDGDYNWYFSLDRSGRPLVEPYNIFSYTFAAMAFGQLSLATFSLAFKYLLNKELAEDAVQNLFLKLWLKKEEIDETKPINRYLFTMLKNDLLNTLRDSKKNIYLLEDCLSMVLELEDNSQNENLKQEQMNIIQQALEQLSPQRRKVFEMKVSGKYSNQEIADKLNLSINTIKFQYSQSLKQIRATVGELSLLLLYCMM